MIKLQVNLLYTKRSKQFLKSYVLFDIFKCYSTEKKKGFDSESLWTVDDPHILTVLCEW